MVGSIIQVWGREMRMTFITPCICTWFLVRMIGPISRYVQYLVKLCISYHRTGIFGGKGSVSRVKPPDKLHGDLAKEEALWQNNYQRSRTRREWWNRAWSTVGRLGGGFRWVKGDGKKPKVSAQCERELMTWQISHADAERCHYSEIFDNTKNFL